LISKNSLIIPLLARRGAETNERSEFVEGVVETEERPPPRLQTLALLGLVTCPEIGLHKSIKRWTNLKHNHYGSILVSMTSILLSRSIYAVASPRTRFGVSILGRQTMGV
jgi:hypothetical protein